MYLHIATSISAAIIASGSAFAQAPPPAAVSSDRLADVPLTTSGSDLLSFYNYSWRSFIALNWPAQKGPGNRGLADRSRAFGDTDGPRVWMTWKSRYEIFQPGGRSPSPWASYDGHNPCGEGIANDVVTLGSFSAFSDFNEAGVGFSLANPLVAQNHTYVRYEVRVNEPEFDSITGNKWYIEQNLPKSAETAVPFNIGSSAVKAAWRILTEIDTPYRSRYYVVRNAQVFDFIKRKCTKQDIALVGFHIATKTRERPQWIWSTFEHVDNVPGKTTEPKPPPTIPFSFNNGNGSPILDPERAPPPISSKNAEIDPSPMQVVRMRPILGDTMEMNRTYWKLPEIKDTVWQNYMLVTTQWPTKVAPEGPTNDGDPFPAKGDYEYAPAASNTAMETYFQNKSCVDCHLISNQHGRDFVMFVTMDAYRPSIRAPGDLFSTKLSDGAGSALSSDPMLRSLIQFFDAARQK
jgi:hypothetical protein